MAAIPSECYDYLWRDLYDRKETLPWSSFAARYPREARDVMKMLRGEKPSCDCEISREYSGKKRKSKYATDIAEFVQYDQTPSMRRRIAAVGARLSKGKAVTTRKNGVWYGERDVTKYRAEISKLSARRQELQEELKVVEHSLDLAKERLRGTTVRANPKRRR